MSAMGVDVGDGTFVYTTWEIRDADGNEVFTVDTKDQALAAAAAEDAMDGPDSTTVWQIVTTVTETQVDR